MYGLFWVFTGLAILFLILGTAINPSVASLFSPPPKSTTKYGSTRFDLPQIVNTGGSNTVFVSYNVTGNDPISEGDFVQVVVVVDFPLNLQYAVLHVEVRPDNAFMVVYYPPSTPEPSQPVPSIIWTRLVSTHPSNVSGGRQVWGGIALIELAAAGVFGATVDVTAIPTPEYWNATRPVYQTTWHFHDQIQTVTIAQRGTAREQMWYENQNLSLTLFILFFASVDIAVTLYDHAYEVVTTNKKDASEQEPKNRKDTLTEEMPPPIVKRQENGEGQAKTHRRRGKANQDQRK